MAAEDIGLFREQRPQVGIELTGQHDDGGADEQCGGIAGNLGGNEDFALQSFQHGLKVEGDIEGEEVGGIEGGDNEAGFLGLHFAEYHR